MTCFIPQGMLSIDVPIIVFQTAKLKRKKSIQTTSFKICMKRGLML